MFRLLDIPYVSFTATPGRTVTNQPPAATPKGSRTRKPASQRQSSWNTSRTTSNLVLKTLPNVSAGPTCHLSTFSTPVNVLTSLPPFYQSNKVHLANRHSHCLAGHSLTIIGFERLKNGAKNLLVFDPSFHDASSIVRLVGQTFVHPMPDLALKPYRRGGKYLGNYREFELLRLVMHVPFCSTRRSESELMCVV